MEHGVYEFRDLPLSLQADEDFAQQTVARYTSLWRRRWQQPEPEDEDAQKDKPHPQSLPLSVLPAAYTTDTAFLQAVVRQRPEAWLMLSAEFKADRTFLLLLQKYNAALVHGVLQTFPDLADQAEFWRKILASQLPELFELMERYATPRIFATPAVMAPAYRQHKAVRALFAPALWRQPALVKFVLEQEGAVAVVDLPVAVLRDQVVSVVESFTHPDMVDRDEEYYTVIGQALDAADLWTDENVLVQSWFEAGLPFLPDVFPASWAEIPELFQLLAVSGNGDSFRHAAPQLKDDLDFMQSIVSESPKLFFQASPRLQHNSWELALTALANADHAFVSEMNRQEERIDYFLRVATTVEAQLQAHHSFGAWLEQMVALLMVSTSTNNPLALVLDGSASAQLQQPQTKIAAFLGVPKKSNLQRLQDAASKFDLVFGGDDDNDDQDEDQARPNNSNNNNKNAAGLPQGGNNKNSSGKQQTELSRASPPPRRPIRHNNNNYYGLSSSDTDSYCTDSYFGSSTMIDGGTSMDEDDGGFFTEDDSFGQDARYGPPPPPVGWDSFDDEI